MNKNTNVTNVAPAHQARIAPRLERAPQPVRIGHAWGASKRWGTGTQHDRRPRGTKITILYFGSIAEHPRNQFIIIINNDYARTKHP